MMNPDRASAISAPPHRFSTLLDQQRENLITEGGGRREREDLNARSNARSLTHVNFGEIELQFPVRILHLRWPFARHLDAITRIFSCTCNIANSKINNDKESQATELL
jgi:hypothetical protein